MDQSRGNRVVSRRMDSTRRRMIAREHGTAGVLDPSATHSGLLNPETSTAHGSDSRYRRFREPSGESLTTTEADLPATAPAAAR